MNLIVISLARASERRENIKSQLAERNIEGIIMDAVDGNELSEIEKNKFLRNPGGWRDGEKFKPGEIGCIKSTINAIRFAKESNWDYVIMLDDDVILSHDFEKGINFAFRIASKEWEHILLGGHIYMNAPPVWQPCLVPVTYKVSGSYAYILRKSIYDKAIENLSLFELPVDDVYENMLKKGIKSFIFFPFLAYPNENNSYIWNKSNTGKIHPSLKYFKDKL